LRLTETNVEIHGIKRPFSSNAQDASPSSSILAPAPHSSIAAPLRATYGAAVAPHRIDDKGSGAQGSEYRDHGRRQGNDGASIY
jgi:hypothetical protein